MIAKAFPSFKEENYQIADCVSKKSINQ